ncbi:MAG: peptidyl-prolyl cis-trans isomerase [Candidatus Cloacimonetes bacterium]|nr:peptidyl-prolyl cis-trans isomerase [Candidatus Cloacimonadota bacterium]
MKNAFLVVAMLAAIIMASGALVAQEQSEETVVLATYSDGQITLDELQKKIAKIPAMYQDRYRTTSGQADILNAMCLEQLFYMEAAQLGLADDQDVIAGIASGQRPVLVAAYRNLAFKEDLVITDEEKRRFYDQEVDRLYTSKPVYTIQYMSVESDSVGKLVRQLFDDGGDFIDIQNQHSASEYARNRGGRVTFQLKHDCYIPGVGKDTLLTDSIIAAEHDLMVGPVTTAKGIHFYKVLEFTDSKMQAYDEVEADIENRLRPLKESQRYYDTIEGLFQRYGVEFDDDLLAGVNLDDITANDAIIEQPVAWGDAPELVYTVGDFLRAYKNLQPQEAAQYSMPGARRNLVHREVEDTVFWLDAQSQNYAELPDVAEELEQTRRAALIRAAYNKIVVEAVDTSDEAVQAVYDENIEMFTTKPTRTIQVFVFASEKKAEKYRKKVAKYADRKQEEKIIKVIDKYCEFQQNNGVLRNLGEDAVLPAFGRNSEMTAGIWTTAIGEVSEVFVTKYNQEERWMFVRVIDEVPAEAMPIEDVRSSILRRIQQTETRAKFEEVSNQLEEKYALQKYPDLLTTGFTAEELFSLAEEAQKKKKFQDAVMYYDQVIEAYQNGSDDYKAMFMKAFLMAEEMNQKPMAIQVFQQVIDNFPEGELHESADFMIKSLTGEIDILSEIDETEQETTE